MNVLLTLTLSQFLYDKGYRFCLVKNAMSNDLCVTLTPLKIRPDFTKLKDEYDALLSIADVKKVAGNMDDELIMVKLETDMLAAYLISFLKKITGPTQLYN